MTFFTVAALFGPTPIGVVIGHDPVQEFGVLVDNLIGQRNKVTLLGRHAALQVAECGYK